MAASSDDGLTFTSSRRAAFRVAIVMPLHPPKFGHARNFLRSMRNCDQSRHFDVFLVFSDRATGQAFKLSLRHANITAALSVPTRPLGAKIRLLIIDPRENRAESYKKLYGVKRVFSDTPGMKYDYALTLDSDTLFQSRRDFSDYFLRWSARKAIPAARIPAPKRSLWYKLHAEVTTSACQRVGLNASDLGDRMPSLWWNDAPLYERVGFERFWSRLEWSRFTSQDARVSGYEHASYVCYKALAESWELFRVHRLLETANSEEQECSATAFNYSFLWSRDENDRRLLLMHADRPTFQVVTSACGAPLDMEGPIHWNVWDS